MNFFKNLEQLSKTVPQYKNEEGYFEFILNSSKKETIQEIKKMFPSFELKKNPQIHANAYISQTIPGIVARAFNDYIAIIVNENNYSLSLSSYSDEDLAKLTFKDYLDNYQTCFSFVLKSADGEDDYDEYDVRDYHQKVLLKNFFGEQIFNSPFSHKNYLPDFLERVYQGLSSVYNTDFIIKKNTAPAQQAPLTFKAKHNDGLEDLIIDVASLIKAISGNEVSTHMIYGLPKDMFKHYLKESRFTDHNFLIIIADIVYEYISQRYSISSDFFVANDLVIQKDPCSYFANEYALLHAISSRRTMGVVNVNNMIVRESYKNTESLIKELITEMVCFFWGVSCIHSTFKYINQAYTLALEENKTLLELKTKEGKYLNKPSTTKECIETILILTNIDKQSLNEQTTEYLKHEIINSDDLSDENLDDVLLDLTDFKSIDSNHDLD